MFQKVLKSQHRLHKQVKLVRLLPLFPSFLPPCYEVKTILGHTANFIKPLGILILLEHIALFGCYGKKSVCEAAD